MSWDLQKHIRIVSKICIAIGVIYLLALAFFSVAGLMAAYNAIGEHPLLPAALSVVPFFAILALLGILHIATGRAFRAGKSWARTSLWILSILNIGNVPLGTGFGIYSIWLLVKTRPGYKLPSTSEKKQQ